jgi:hypothetical protein
MSNSIAINDASADGSVVGFSLVSRACSGDRDEEGDGWARTG